VQVPYDDGTEVGEGFYQIWNGSILVYIFLLSEYVPTLTTAINDLWSQMGSNSRIVVTGHSLGGAIATLCAQYLSTVYPYVSIYTYGSPRVGNYAFAELFNSTVTDSYRVINRDDIVPHLPYFASTNFHHVPREIWFYVGGEYPYAICGLSGEDQSCADSLPTYEWSVSVLVTIVYNFQLHVGPHKLFWIHAK
jgi:hypothetical protein